MKSYIAKPADVQRKWYIVDAEGKNIRSFSNWNSDSIKR